MAALKLGFLLFLPLTVSSDGGVTREKTVGNKPDVTPICSNETLNIITLIVCKITTERNGEECRLLYQHGHDFEHGCGSGFRLIKENQTVFLHLSSLTPADSGNYTCECSHPAGTDIFHLIVTVEDFEDESQNHHNEAQTMTHRALISGSVFITAALILSGFLYRRHRHGKQPESPSHHPNLVPQDIEPYSTFIRTGSGLYSTVKLQPHI
ncbi:uncharacterized protein LOC111579478 [Amphiprion ocellaris]|uniref:uncharacterized protein LOC111579478 n=1 Tax=Amphiprion ocellaris TaxID=80972 RepID=UPI0024111ED1|nr:uncharacterized protein LOC111579478 [Amphiprion ocellaris]